MSFSAAMRQPRFEIGDTGYDTGLGFQAQYDAADLTSFQNLPHAPGKTTWPAMLAALKNYAATHPYPIAGRDPIKSREAIARTHWEGIADYGYYADKVVFSANGNIDPANGTPEAIFQAAAYPRPFMPDRIAGPIPRVTMQDWLAGYYVGPYDAENFTAGKRINPATGELGTVVELWTPDNRPTYNFRFEGGLSAFRDIITTATLVAGAFGIAALTAPAAAATSTAANVASLTAVPAATVTVPAAVSSGASGIALAAGKTLAGLAVSKAVASVVASKPETPADSQALMAAQLQQAQLARGTSTDNTGLFLAGGLLLLKILL